ncbi:unnamed protein product [Dibothriocephalus latus]|uniref:Reverse transcriptase domain-containing protein n=1 Tax=Dibothriocephalus latus TaxID=60516 RepID=A0A3P7LVT1_DIBLA|nr:unnamed protein product [Dibothriocephalus latus]
MVGALIIEDILFGEKAILEEIKSLKGCKSPDPDEIPAKLLHRLARELAKPLSIMCQQSFDAGSLPSDWKTAHITPLHKSGIRALANSYKPVSFTSISCKVMERITKKETLNFFSYAQYGFRKVRSCATNLLYTMPSWTRAIDAKDTVNVAYVDFPKAFDSVPHQRLLHELRVMDIGEKRLTWIENFLAGRFQTVCAGRQRPRPTVIKSGAPQGLVLFNLFVDDCV